VNESITQPNSEPDPGAALQDELESFSRCFNALSHSGRLRMFMLVCLSAAGVNVGRVAESLSITLSGASKGLKELADCDLVIPVQVGQYVVYVPNKERVTQLKIVLEKLDASIPSKGV